MNAQDTQGLRELCLLLEAEAEHYVELLELAREQGRHMRNQDIDALAENTQRWLQTLPEAEVVRSRRENLASELRDRLAAGTATASLGGWIPHLSADQRREVEPAVRRLRATARALARQNELNRRLAEFNLDLVEGEAALFCKNVLADPAGRYDGNAHRARSEPGGVIMRQA